MKCEWNEKQKKTAKGVNRHIKKDLKNELEHVASDELST